MGKKSFKKRRIGRSEVIDFPELRIKGIPAKIDTGAFTSSIAYKKVKEKRMRGELVLEVELDDQFYNSRRKLRKFQFLEFEKKVVKNSFGDSEERYLIETDLKIFNHVFSTEFTLAKRTSLRFPVLLGRKFLDKRFFVDVSYSNLSVKKKNK